MMTIAPAFSATVAVPVCRDGEAPIDVIGDRNRRRILLRSADLRAARQSARHGDLALADAFRNLHDLGLEAAAGIVVEDERDRRSRLDRLKPLGENRPTMRFTARVIARTIPLPIALASSPLAYAKEHYRFGSRLRTIDQR
jgi:hypothetical protein